jgi:phenylpropionate dioxygenase-like ring-hydroxylating dioxygenase large terminal subunit
MGTLLRDFWYVALPAKKLKPGKSVRKKMLGEPVLVGRRSDGKVFAMRDICPHRGIPLSYGSVESDGVRCCYHGWKFNTDDGRCCEIPSLPEPGERDISRIRVQTYPCREVQGHIWVFIPAEGNEEADPSTLPEVPTVPEFGDMAPGASETLLFTCNVDHAVIGLMDPAHGSFVHTSWWWRTGPRKFRVKEKQYEPVPMGFRLVPYEMPASARPYKLLGDTVSTEIIFQLPTIRTEFIRGNRHKACGLTTITPLDENLSEVHHSIYSTVPWMGLVKPLIHVIIRVFLGQDRDVVVKQQEGLADDPRLMLIDDGDTQAKWYFRLKEAHERSQKESQPFENPVTARVLRWRS